MEAGRSTVLGMVVGYIKMQLTGNIYESILVALCTGAAAYIGQQVIKYIHLQIKKRKHK